MHEETYTIKEASEILELESHTLRYYEDELELDIPRNSMGHRYYRKKEIDLFRYIIELKEQGLQLKAIKNAIQSSEETYLQASSTLEASSGNVIDITDMNNMKVQQFCLMMKETFIQAIAENQEGLKLELNDHIKTKIEEEMQEEMQKLEYKLEEKDKERYRKLDEALREMQKMRKEMADITTPKKEKRSLFGKIFGKKGIEEEQYSLEE